MIQRAQGARQYVYVYYLSDQTPFPKQLSHPLPNAIQYASLMLRILAGLAH